MNRVCELLGSQAERLSLAARRDGGWRLSRRKAARRNERIQPIAALNAVRLNCSKADVSLRIGLIILGFYETRDSGGYVPLGL